MTEQETREIEEIEMDMCGESYGYEGYNNRNIERYAVNLYNVGYRKIPDGAEVVFVKGETAREQVERIIQLSEHCDINDIVVVTKMEYSDLILTRNNYEHAKAKIEELQGIIEKQDEQKIRLAQAYTREKTKAEQIRKKTAGDIFEKIHQKEGYYPLASVGTSQNDMTAIAKEYGIKYTSQGVEEE